MRDLLAFDDDQRPVLLSDRIEVERSAALAARVVTVVIAVIVLAPAVALAATLLAWMTVVGS